MDENSVESISAAGQRSVPDEVVFEKNLDRGQFTSPARITLPWVQFVGFVANDERGVRILIVERRPGQEDVLHEAVHPDYKPEGPGLSMEVLGDDLHYTITEHLNVVASPRPNAVRSGLFFGLAAPPSRPDFADVPPDNWAYEPVMACARRGIIMGYSDGTFRPGNSVTRAQLAVMLSRAFGWT